MPLVRFEVKNEFGLGDPVLYRSKKDCDPKVILDGVAVAGLVGILRQLGDLAELASDIFHDLHEQVMATSARGRKLSTRMQHLETELPLLENAIRGQRSHLHFAFVAGSNWHADLQFTQSHLLSSELPRFIMDSYEECRDPPRLHLLDRFDTAGTGACLKRYSDPSYFKRVWAVSEMEKAEKVQIGKKAQKIKRKGSRIKNGEGQESASLSRRYSSTCFLYPSADEQSFSTEVAPMSAMKLKSEIASRSSSFGSGIRLNDVEQVHYTISSAAQVEVEDDSLSASNLQINQRGSFASDIHDKENGTIYSSSHSSLKEAHRSPSVTWDEKTEILKPMSPVLCNDILVDGTQYSEPWPVSSEQSSDVEPETSTIGDLDQGNILSCTTNVPTQLSSISHFDEIASDTDNYMDALNMLESETETDSECQTKRELESFPNFSNPQATSETSQIQEMASNSDLASDDTAGGSQSSNEDASPHAYNFIHSESTETTEPVKRPRVIESIPDPKYSIDNQISNCDPFDMSKMGSFEANNQPQEPGVSQIQEMTSPSFDFNGSDTPSGFQSSLNEDERNNANNSMPSEILEPMSPPHSTGLIPNPNDSIGNQKSEGNSVDMSRMNSFEDVAHQPLELSQMQEMTSPSFDFSDADTPSGSQSSLNEDECKNADNSMPAEILEPMNPPHSKGLIPDANDSLGNRKFGGISVDMSRMNSFEGVTHQHPELILCNSLTVLGHKITANESESSASTPVNTANVPSPKLWTNGGLLGLEPSKPPVFGITGISSKDLVCDSNNSGYDRSSTQGETKLHGNGFAGNPEMVPSSRNSSFVHKTDELPSASFNQNSLTDDQQFGSGDNVISRTDPSQNGCGITLPSGSELPSNNSVVSQPNESAQSTMDIASSISALAQRILSSSLQRKQSIVHSQNEGVNPDVIKHEDISLINNQKEGSTGVKSETCHAENANNIKHLSTKNSILSSSHLSGHSSPPLEHMKISFHPMNGLETSKLKLEYATDNLHEGTEDLSFLSFQLLPGPNLSFENNGSETDDDDDDTFCRSCPYTSEDHFSPRSDSNSELWEQEDMSGENNHRMYNDLRRISLSRSSISSFKGFSGNSYNDPATGFYNLEAENSMLHVQNGNSVRHHGCDSLISTNGEGQCDSLSIDPEIFVSQSQNELPPPPPLSPMQWRMMKAPAVKEEENSSVAEIVEHFNVLQVQRFTAHKRQEQSMPKPPSFPETLGYPIKKPENQQNPDGKLESNHAINGKGLGAKEELLHQSRKIHDGQKLNGHKEIRHSDVDSKQLDGREGLLQIRNKHDSQKLNGHEEPNIPSSNGQEVDEREELLHQIRNKTFNLRNTTKAKTSLMSQPTTNFNVAAILEKANAIRQAFVGSDGGNDDNWSDG